MSDWKVRHQGSPRSIEGLSLPQVLEGMQDGRWEPTDEVMGPQDGEWTAIENHPQLAEVAAELEPPPPRVYDDETRLDMTALIDVTMVLLIFFILTTSYSLLQKRLDAPNPTSSTPGPAVITKEQVQQTMVMVTIKMEDGKPVTQIEGKPTTPNRLEYDLGSALSGAKRYVVLQYDDDVPEKSVVEVLDAARGNHVDRVSLVVPDKK
jgi:biopolymer transport protein ExbD